MTRLPMIIGLCAWTQFWAMAGDFAIRMETTTMFHEKDVSRPLEVCTNRLWATMAMSRDGENLQIQLSGLGALWQPSSNMPPEKGLLLVFDKAMERYTAKEPFGAILGKSIRFPSQGTKDDGFRTWGEAIGSLSSADVSGKASQFVAALLAKLPILVDVDTSQLTVGDCVHVPFRERRPQGEVTSDMRATDLVCEGISTNVATFVSREKKKLGRHGLLSWDTKIEYDTQSGMLISINEEVFYRTLIGRTPRGGKTYTRKEIIHVARARGDSPGKK